MTQMPPPLGLWSLRPVSAPAALQHQQPLMPLASEAGMPVASSQATNQRALAQQNRPMHAAMQQRRDARRNARQRAPRSAARTCGGGENELGGLLRVERIATNSDIFVLVDLQWVADLSAPGLAPTRRAGPASPLPAGGRWRERPSAHCWRAAWRCASSPVASLPHQGCGVTAHALQI